MNRLTSLAAAALVALGTVSAAAQDEPSAMQVQFGAITFSFYCVTCHGRGAEGDGAVADALAVHPLDLTRLAADNGGAFPEERVRAVIDGREEIVGHVEVAMPPWGRLFAHELRDFEEDAARNAIISRRIDHIVAYLKSIQR